MAKLTPHQKGGRKQRKTMIERYGRDCFKRIGKLGGNPALLKKDIVK
jgi:hypothetical protein